MMETSEPRNAVPTRTATVVIMALSIASTCSVLAAISRYGPGLSIDSTEYVAAARCILAGQGVMKGEGIPFVSWPPLLPALLALLGLTRIDVMWLGGLVNAAAFGGIVAASGLWLLRACRHRALAVLGTVWVAASIPVFYVSRMLLSEPLFILFTVLFLRQAQRWREAPRPGRLVVAGLLVALASLTRYIGVTLGVTGCLMILVGSREPVRRRLRACLLFGAVAAVPLMAWLARNLALTGTPAGPRFPSNVGIVENVARMGQAMARFFLPPGKADALPGTVWLSGMVAGALVLAALAMRGRHWREGEVGPAPAAGPLAFCAVYAGAMLLTATLVAMTPLERRYLSPVYVPAVLFVFFALDDLIPREGRSGAARWALLAVLVATAGWAGRYGIWCSERVATYMRTGAGGYNSGLWRESGTLAYLRRTELPFPIYSNDPEAIHVLDGKKARLTPREARIDSDVRPGAEEVTGFVGSASRSGGATLVWFDSCRRENLYDLPALRRFVHLELVARLPDGAVYRVTARR